MYFCGACFALVTIAMAVLADYRAWGEIAAVAYGGGAAVCAGARWWQRRRGLPGRAVSFIRRAVLLAVMAGALLVPLGAELAWRANAGPGAHAQPEVAVIERAGDRAATGQDPYLAHPRSVGIAPASDRHSVDANTFFPYMPAMVIFGMANALAIPPELQDARVALVAFTLVVAVAALLASDATLARRGRILQFLIVLPSGALPMVTGGDDLPVLALMLLGVVLATKRRPVAAGIALGFAASLKFTAWPLVVLLAFAASDQAGRRARGRYVAAVVGVLAPVLAAGMSLSVSSFLENVVRFPLGLAHVKSPAASPMIGQVFVSMFPQHKTLITAGLLVIGAGIVLAVLVRYPPRTPAAAAAAAAFVLALATLLAPATRFGYFIYPTDLLVWAYVFSGAGLGVPAEIASLGPAPSRRLWHLTSLRPQSPPSTSNTLSSTELVGATSLPPASAGVIDGFTGSTTTPTSQ